ncbi:alpha/beta hydrolase [Sneathiella aquimaris]|uniref:alpha/beta hydrolase n=1 Tax=Sneathiella aquimaris TaxID=2599305 RepID=UPI00146BFD76|nr:alpha/beta hydrolase [Sneathiella aquimaris]
MSLPQVLKVPYFLYKRFLLMKASDAYWKRKIGSRALCIDGRTLDPRAQALIELQGEFGVPASQWTVPMLRGGYNKSMELFDGPKHPLKKVEDISISLPERDIKGRLYDPNPGVQQRPGLVYFHGGGFVIGGLESHDRFCRKIALETGNPVIAVDYRLGPEHKFPAPQFDALDSWKWVQAHSETLGLDASKISVAGDSAGAGLALLVTSEASKGELGHIPVATALVYPPMMNTPKTVSRDVLAKENIVLTQELLDWFSSHFVVQTKNGQERLLSPMDHAISGKINPTWIRVCGFDPLRDDGQLVANQLETLGALIDFAEFEDLYHGFIGASAILKDVDAMIADLARFINKHTQYVAGDVQDTEAAQ